MEYWCQLLFLCTSNTVTVHKIWHVVEEKKYIIILNFTPKHEKYYPFTSDFPIMIDNNTNINIIINGQWYSVVTADLGLSGSFFLLCSWGINP
jgi:hypothetical protein